MAVAYINGNVYTMKAEGDRISAFVTENGRFLYCGDDAGALRAAGPGAEVVDLGGQTVLPGMIDTHQHLFAYARDLTKLDLKNCMSKAELLKRVAERAARTEKGGWITGTGFDQQKFTDEKELPTRKELDRAAPENPVVLTRYCLHVNCANSLALEAAGIGRDYVPTVEGTVMYGPDGKPNGILNDNAGAHVLEQVPDSIATQEGKKKAIEAALYELNKVGLTGVTAVQATHVNLPEYGDVYQYLRDEGKLTVRICLAFDRLPNIPIRTGFGDEMIRFGYYKLFADGNMGGRTAYLSEPFSDDPGNYGIANYTQEYMNEQFKAGYDRGITVGIHAIGDAAITQVAEAIEYAIREKPTTDRRAFRLLHASLVTEELLDRLAKLPVTCDVQPMFLPTDVHWLQDRFGSRSNYVFCWRKFLDRGMILTGGSDSPIETFNPMIAAYAITTRQGLDGYPEGGWYPENKVTTFEALTMFTKNAAFVSGEDDIKGTIETGKLADFVIPDRDPFTTPPEELRYIKIRQTFLGGKTVYREANE